ncbi:GPP34 family phosphoprotein [Desulfosporosinus lacus]|uniref:Golgi phosphoprotein 3 (GPP34) n=1 Tax=Desulfosporosinus lacus DSM 15449 TaxID=1121420 RepID=A0A1M5ZHC9_9FIRM|nr:GPP34 family phosphoprotein [Desulfosporosinus lacus]SHI23539.1 Golgi phosphoprotein 3 (GPP34) [Desulfosporosinus lacus DSM 15449]
MLNNLSIPQEFALLALDRDTNRLKSIFRQYIPLYTVMTCFVELLIDGKIKFEDNDTITVTNSTPTGEKLRKQSKTMK